MPKPLIQWGDSSLATVFVAALCVAGFLSLEARAMDVRVIKDQLILSGAVIDGDLNRIEKALKSNARIKTVILRNSPGGHPQTGFSVGELIREKGLTTAVSGYCYSSCSRMYLGGVKRIFTDDFPAGATEIGFHGHYKKDGSLDTELMKQTGLRDWIIRFLDGKADVSLVDRWVNIPRNNGLIHVFNPSRVKRGDASTFFCSGPEPPEARPFKCEAIAKSALDLGVSTSSDVIKSNDQEELGNLVPPILQPIGFAQIGEVEKLPVTSEAARNEYRKFLEVGAHRAFAVSHDRKWWGWSASGISTVANALTGCAERAKGPCRLYAVDEDVVWHEP
jgi:hypothetical protein